MKGLTQHVCMWDESKATFARRTVYYVARMQVAWSGGCICIQMLKSCLKTICISHQELRKTMFRGICLALCALTMLSAPALAGGGGGTKKDATIKVTNDIPSTSSSRIGVILDQTPAQLTAIATAANPEQAFTDAGGKFLNPGANASFSVKSGDHVISIVGISPSPPFTSQGLIRQGTRAVGRGATLSLNATSL